MLLFLTNDRTLFIPLDKFKEIAALSPAEKSNFEVIDGENLSFLALDEIYNIHDLIDL